MARLRWVAVTGRDPDAWTKSNRAFMASAEPVCAVLSERLSRLQLQARYQYLTILLDPDPSGDGRLHCRPVERPDFETERAHVTLPAPHPLETDETRRLLFGALVRAVLQWFAPRRGWPAETVEELLTDIAPTAAPDNLETVIVFDAPPVIEFLGGGGPINDPRSARYADHMSLYLQRFEQDPEWRQWWLATGRQQVDLRTSFEGTIGLRTRITTTSITITRTTSPGLIPANRLETDALVEADLTTALARLRERLKLPPHPPLRR